MSTAWSTLHDIAYLYLFLAADVDGNLADAEVDAIIELLQRRLPAKQPEKIRRVVGEAAAERRAEQPRPVRRVIEALKYAPLLENQRSALLDDLLQVARADGKVLPAEKAFIHALARVWNIDLPADMERPVHDLALVYLFMAMGHRDALQTSERDAVLELLGEWEPGLAPETLQLIVRTATQQLQSGQGDHQLGQAVTALKKALPLAAQRRVVLDAVMRIAQADGELSDNELAFFLRLTKALELAG